MSTDNSKKLKQFIEKIAAENGFKTTEIVYRSGSEIGDGFMSINTAVDLNNGVKSLHLFCKAQLQSNWSKAQAGSAMFANEMYFYKTIYPAYQEFLKEKCIDDGFRNVPKCYGVNEDVIVLENLKQRGFDLFAKGKYMNDDHILFTLRTFSKFHAVSFALKDQKSDLYNSLLPNVNSCFTDMMLQAGFDKLLAVEMKTLLKSLDPVEDKHILDATGDLVEKLLDAILNIDEYPCNNRILIHGDSWCNNMMYLYDGKNRETPVDLMVLDWQVMRYGSPALDLAYFIYCIASESSLENLERYLEAYHEELSKRIVELGSDPEVLYPFSALKEDWMTLAKYAFGLGFFVVKTLVADREDLTKFEEFPDPSTQLVEDEEMYLESIMVRLKNEDEFLARMKVILTHFVKNNFL